MKLLDLIKSRHSCYQLKDTLSCNQQALFDQLKAINQNSPYAYGIATSKTVILTGSKHRWYWQLVSDSLQQKLNKETFEQTKKRLAMFFGAFGTVLFFEDPNAIRQIQAAVKIFDYEKCLHWAMQHHGIVMYSYWLTMQEFNVGANIQHYGNMVNKQVCKQLDLPSDWILVGEMPFGDKNDSNLPSKQKTIAKDAFRVL